MLYLSIGLLFICWAVFSYITIKEIDKIMDKQYKESIKELEKFIKDSQNENKN